MDRGVGANVVARDYRLDEMFKLVLIKSSNWIWPRHIMTSWVGNFYLWHGHGCRENGHAYIFYCNCMVGIQGC